MPSAPISKRISRTRPVPGGALWGERRGASIWVEKRYALWYNAEGIRIAEGESAQRSSATLLSWEQAAARIRELLDLGRYMPQSELDRVDHYEVHELADRLLLMFRDIEDEEKRFFPRCAPSMINRADSRRQRKKSQGCLAGKMAYRPSSLNMKCLPQPTRRTRTLCGSVFTVRLRSRHSLQIYSGSRCTLPPPKDTTHSGVSSFPG